MINKTHFHLSVFVGVLFAVLAIVTIGIALTATKVHANPTGFSPSAQTSAATTTPTYLSSSIATSTVVYDSYGVNGTNQASTGSTQAADSVTLLQQFAGSSTASTLNTIIQYSQDGKDWYSLGVGSNVVMTVASSSPALAPAVIATLPFASSTPEGMAPFTPGSGNATSTTRVMLLPMPTRYVRAVSYLPAGSLNGAVWQQFVPKKQNY